MKFIYCLLLLLGIAMGITMNVRQHDGVNTNVEFVSTPTATSTSILTRDDSQEIDIDHGTALQTTLMSSIRTTIGFVSRAARNVRRVGLHRRRLGHVSSVNVRSATVVTMLCDSNTGRHFNTSAAMLLARSDGILTTDSYVFTVRSVPTATLDRVALAINLAEGNFQHVDQSSPVSVATTTMTLKFGGLTWSLTRTSTVIIGTATTQISLHGQDPLITATADTIVTPTITATLHLSTMPIISEAGFCHYKDNDILFLCTEPVDSIAVATVTTAVTAVTAAATVTSGVGQAMDNPIGSVIRFVKEILK